MLALFLLSQHFCMTIPPFLPNWLHKSNYSSRSWITQDHQNSRRRFDYNNKWPISIPNYNYFQLCPLPRWANWIKLSWSQTLVNNDARASDTALTQMLLWADQLKKAGSDLKSIEIKLGCTSFWSLKIWNIVLYWYQKNVFINIIQSRWPFYQRFQIEEVFHWKLKYWSSLCKPEAWDHKHVEAAHVTSLEDKWAQFELFRNQHRPPPPDCRYHSPLQQRGEW